MTDGDNPFSRDSPLPLRYPAFDAIHERHFEPAFVAGMAEHTQEIEHIAGNPEPATFANTVEALERSGQMLSRVSQVFFNLVGSDGTPQLRELHERLAPQLSTHQDAICLNAELFARIDQLHRDRADRELTAEQIRLLEKVHSDFVRAGAGLGDHDARELRALNEELSTLAAQFSSKLLADTAARAVHITDVEELAGLSADRIAVAAQAARTRGLPGHLLPLSLPTGQPDLAALTNRSVRQRVYASSIGRGTNGDENDTRATIVSIVRLRARRAALLGYEHHAEYVAADETAQDSEAVNAMLDQLVGPAMSNARRDAAELTELLHADGHTGPLQPWDWAYYEERMRAERFSIDAEALRPYFELGSVLDNGLFFAAQRLFGLTFARREDLPVYHADVQVFDVHDADGSQRGIFLADWYERDNKRGGAWMSSFVDQSELLGRRPVILINLNVPKPPPGQPALLTLELVRTAFHEFGHALHGLLSTVRYPSLSGTNVPRDFVEYPSQVNEMWMWDPDVLASYARHHRTGEQLPAELVRALLESREHGAGFATAEYLGAALLDQEWHLLPDGARWQGHELRPQDVAGFEDWALSRRGVNLPQAPPRYRSTYFAHAFTYSYAAAYYAYIWSEVLDADTVDWFAENGGLTRAAGDAFRAEILSVGNARDPRKSFQALRGRDPVLEPLLRRRGLTSGRQARAQEAPA